MATQEDDTYNVKRKRENQDVGLRIIKEPGLNV